FAAPLSRRGCTRRQATSVATAESFFVGVHRPDRTSVSAENLKTASDLSADDDGSHCRGSASTTLQGAPLLV
ncbi:MAG TPA: hypothetical protein VM692_05065, partial [Gammaproteobacteria bacterium]|nr:hypothetical protein [Gammaproteobacteria bacterium]